ncbi:MAG TPA: serine/threonine-protein kinase [Polyangiaceae bacterium]|jgi:serine/threonine-protein kinase|nr:serine/threonine-protein kinase [Polyangiaceae bacterium]
MSDSLPPVTGLVAGKYQIVGLIGRGGMGSVWEGRHASLGTRVAIKFIDPEYAESKEACARFVTEARAAATIQSKHAIQILDHGVSDNGRPYMVMELLVGEPLDKRIERLGTLTLRDTARVIGHVCRALQRAHDAGIIHRDLKPENIFLVRTPDDDDEIAKVLDFGIAKIKPAPGEEGLTSSTKTGAVLGTPYYMSPEQARGLRNVDHRSDLWSLGVIAYKCVTGVLPFEGESVGDLLVKICTGPVPVPSVTVPGLPASFDGWFAHVLAREPEARFASASELAEGLAMAAGLSGRGPTSLPERALPVASGARTTPASTSNVTPLPAAGVTSAPFTTGAGLPTKASRGVIFAVAAAALVGGSIGVFAVVRFVASPAAPAAAASAIPSQANQASLLGSSTTSGVDHGAAAEPSAHAPAASAVEPPAPSARPAPASPAALAATAVPRPVASPHKAAPPPAAVKASPAKPAPNAADPGY